jgi:bacillithiol biosynthesis cysteine-adding enzyme BshC
MPTAQYLPYGATQRFSALVLDYLDGKSALQDLYSFAPDEAGIAAAIEARQGFGVDRQTLVNLLREQYSHLSWSEDVEANLTALESENTFTICTAHQPNLGTGYLYFVYKILHAIRLSHELNERYPDKRFVPVYYMGSEDADLDELGTFRIGDRKFVWDAGGQTGAVGRMNTATLAPLLRELFSLLGPPGPFLEALQVLLMQAYTGEATIAQATRYLVHGLFGRYGLIILDPDSAELKRGFIPVMKADLLEQPASKLVPQTIAEMEAAGYKAQAFPREINLFYLRDDLRERIVREGDAWSVLNTGIRWNEAELLAELEAHPERFSPNVMLRPLYQEHILPNVAFIGGGAEVAYWLQLKGLFDNHGVFYPAVLLRQSVMWLSKDHQDLMQKIALPLEQLFHTPDEAARCFVEKHGSNDWSTDTEHVALTALLDKLREKATKVDPTLEKSAIAALRKMEHQLEVLRTKMLRAEKRRQSDGLARLERLQKSLFPAGGLQERVENFMPYFLAFGADFFDVLLQGIRPLGRDFLIIEA